MIKGYCELNQFCNDKKLNVTFIKKLAKKYKVNIITFGDLSYFELIEMEKAIEQFFVDRNEFINNQRNIKRNKTATSNKPSTTNTTNTTNPTTNPTTNNPNNP